MLSRIMPLTSALEPPTPRIEAIDGTLLPVLDDVLISVGRPAVFGRDETVFYEGEPCSRLFRVVEGAVRICRFRRDGTRQIEAFHLPGDYFGFDIEGDARFTAQATTSTTLIVAEGAAVLTPEARFCGVTAAIWNLAVQELHRSQNHAFLLGYRHAQDRVVAFLEEMARRLNRGSSIDLPMPRQDIADYLGLTIETVSRSFTDLARSGVIGMPRPRSVILKKAMRARVTGSFDSMANTGISQPSSATRFN